jgi:hypothetical protein
MVPVLALQCCSSLHEWLHAESKQNYAIDLARWARRQRCVTVTPFTSSDPSLACLARVSLQKLVDRSTNQARASAFVITSQRIESLNCR